MNVLAETYWSDDIENGIGILRNFGNETINIPYHFHKNFKKTITIPEEIMCFAYSSCFNVSLAMILDCYNYQVSAINTYCRLYYDFEGADNIVLSIRAEVKGITLERLKELVYLAHSESHICSMINIPSTIHVSMY